MAGELQRGRGESRQRIEREADHLLQRIFGLAGEPLMPVIGERDLPEADPRHHAADETRLLGHRQQSIQRPPAHQPEVAGIERDVDFGRARKQAVEAMRRRPLEHGLALAAAAHAIDHVGALASIVGKHRAEQLGRVLQVGIDDQDPVTPAQVEAGGQRQLVPMVARQVDCQHMRVRCGHRLHHRPGRIARSVVDQHQLIILADGIARGRAQPLVKLPEAASSLKQGTTIESAGLVMDASDRGCCPARARPDEALRHLGVVSAGRRSARHNRNPCAEAMAATVRSSGGWIAAAHRSHQLRRVGSEITGRHDI